MSAPDFSAVTQRALAAMIAVDERTIRRWSDDVENRMPRNDDGTYNAPVALAWWKHKEAGSVLDLNAERARLAKEQADRTALENAVKRGELLSVQTVATEWARMVSAARAKVLGMPSQLAPQLAVMKNALAITDALTAKFNAALAHLADYRPGDGSADDSSADRADGEDLAPATEINGKPVGRSKKVSERRK